MEKKRSVGVTVLGIFTLLHGCFNLIIAILMPFSIPVYLWSFLIISIGIGLLMLKEWARFATIALIVIRWISFIGIKTYFIVTKNQIPPEFSKDFSNNFLGLFLITATFLIVYYLTRPKVKEQFH